MLLIVQIIIAIGGVVALFNGEFKVTKKIVLYGNHARVVGAVALMQATLTLVLGLVLSAVFYDTDVAKDFFLVFLLIQIIFVMSPFIVGYFYKDKSAYNRESLPIPGSISTYPADAPTFYQLAQNNHLASAGICPDRLPGPNLRGRKFGLYTHCDRAGRT